MPEVMIDRNALEKADPQTRQAVEYFLQGVSIEKISYILNLRQRKIRKMIQSVIKRKVQIMGHKFNGK